MIPYGKHFIDDEDIKSVVDVLKSGHLTQGPMIEKFEKEFANYVGAKYAVAVSSGTAGLHIANLSLGLSPESSLVTSPITFVASANSARFVNAKVLFADVEENTINLSPLKLEEVVNSKENIGAIMPVHFAGLPCSMKQIKSIADSINVPIIEDAAHALGSKYQTGERVGSCKYSSMTVFSFHPVKIIASGEGGMVTTNNEEIYVNLLRYRSHGINKLDDNYINSKLAYSDGGFNPWYYEMQDLGFNYRITDIQSALALSQLKKIDSFVDKRRKLAQRYDQFFNNLKNVIPIHQEYRDISSHHLYVLRIDFKSMKISRRNFMEALRSMGVGSQVHYMPVPMHPYYESLGFDVKNYPNSLNYYHDALSIPLYFDLSLAEQDYVMNSIKHIINSL